MVPALPKQIWPLAIQTAIKTTILSFGFAIPTRRAYDRRVGNNVGATPSVQQHRNQKMALLRDEEHPGIGSQKQN
ncbi:hypothetical protein NDU88_003135 [Pleurodeles waltl]|uniref:Uncharacterized protein n=1 Tax=Pleurodeles waltl TaxID=8319 RepID=A0AAV7SF19_PLEWA|nr:hypothetical protein NDU88_003135 [Pleurodeles waltl]